MPYVSFDFYSSFKGPISQTIRAHRLACKAWELGGPATQLPLMGVLYKAYAEEEKDIADFDVLAEIAEAANVMSKNEVSAYDALALPTTSSWPSCFVYCGILSSSQDTYCM